MGHPTAHQWLLSAVRPTILGRMSRDAKTPEEHVAQTRAWKADLRSTPEGEAEYQEMCVKAVDAAQRLATRRSA